MTGGQRTLRAAAGAAAIHGLLIAAPFAWRAGAVDPRASRRDDIAVRAVTSGPGTIRPAPSAKTAASRQSETARTEHPAVSSGAAANGAAAPGAGGGEAAADGRAESLLAEIRARIEGSLNYPVSLQRRGLRGTSTLRIRIDRSGVLESADIAESSGHSELDSLAIEAAREAAPYPSHASTGALQLLIPIEFRSSLSP